MSHGKRELKTEHKGGKTFLTVLLVLALIAGGAWGAWQIFVKEPEIVPAMNAESGEPAAAAESLPSGDYVRKEHCWTFLLVGMDKVGSNTDSLILVRYDTDAQSVSMASIPRDTRVDCNRKLKKINAAYANGGMDLLREEVSRTFGIPVDFTVKVDVQGFVALVDELGGIDFYVPCAMNYDDPYQDLYIHYEEGMQHLSGQQALEVCRFRHNNDNTGYTDTGRMETQRGVLTAIAKKMLSWNSLTKVNSYLGIVGEYVDTDLSANNIAWFAGKAIGFDMNREGALNTMMMPAAWKNPYMYLDPAATLEVVNTYLNPYTTDRTAEMLDVIPAP